MTEPVSARSIAADEQVLKNNRPETRCPRCGGRTFAESDEGDRSCFTCGNVIYLIQPATDVLRTRQPKHGNQNL